jgi:hypothetical protein
LLALGTVYYRLGSALSDSSVVDKTSVANHSLYLGKLAEGEYLYWLAATSTSKTWLKSSINKFTVGNPLPAGIVEPARSPAITAASDPSAPTGEAVSAIEPIRITNITLYNLLKGKIVLRVESRGEAYYLNPATSDMYSLGRPADAFEVMRSQGVGVTNLDLGKIPVGLVTASGIDTDNDGLSDLLEDALGLDKNKADTDGDGFNDREELSGGYNPNGSGNLATEANFAKTQKGKIFLQVESNGEAWYVNPADSKRYFLGRPADAFNVMRGLGLGISNTDFDRL